MAEQINDPSTILQRLKSSEGDERRRDLDELTTTLNRDHAAILQALRHGSGDVQRAALEAIDESYLRTSHADVKVAVLAILGKIVSNYSLSARRTAASALAVLSRTISLQSDSFTATDSQSIARTLLVYLSCGFVRKTVQRPTAPGSAFNFGVGGSTSTARKKASSSSLRSAKAESIISTGWESESAASESETDHAIAHIGSDQQVKRMTAVSRIVRQRSIVCLEVLLKRSSRLLLTSWPSIVCESEAGQACLLDIVERDETVSNCTAACRVCETLFEEGNTSGAFASAEERSRNAFTSLSNRIASTIVMTRTRLVSILQTRSQTALMESVLRCLAVIVRTTSKAKLRHSHADALRSTALKCCAHQEPAIAIRAYTLLNSLNADAAPVSVDDQLVESMLKRLGDDSLSAEVKAEAWSASKTIPSTIESRDLALRHLQIGNEVLKQAVASYVLAQKGKEMQEHVELLCEDEHPSVRAIGADCLAYGTQANKPDILLDQVLSDTDPTVRAAAVRAIGVRLQAGLPHCDHSFINLLHDPSYLVRSRASWTLGNLCEAKPDLRFLRQCLVLRHCDARLCMHAVRGVGSVLANCSIDGEDENISACLRWLREILDKDRDPKLRWNTCSALSRIFSSDNSSDLLRRSQTAGIEFIDILVKLVSNDRIFKTRLAACSAIRGALERTQASQQTREATRAGLVHAQANLAAQVSSASFYETQQHIIPLQSELDRVLALISS